MPESARNKGLLRAEQHHILLATTPVNYQLKRSAKRRSIGLQISGQGLVVSAPPAVSHIYIEALLKTKAGWILSKLQRWQTEAGNLEQVDLSAIDWLGQPKKLLIHTGPTRVTDDAIWLACKAGEETRALGKFMQAAAMQYFSARIEQLKPSISIRPISLHLSHAKTRWGSCSSAGAIRLNWRLMQAPPAVIDYVLIHELAHLRELNHSDRFWQIVASVCPNYKHHRQFLRQNGARYFAW
ncbi:M48 family metallopeptidase [Parachitinimonas caeni]|uniref:SprT family zinc-dependent metalloprotease n=1 Tax=Parachitinimonas caeni TaxID=3031301 RepID=A0ABT7E0W8_9NEIS|nr:SprT family zinc-dependent metalloprotease [Parachitinimonas caeni]MDK2125958.1 SprT family zinc-dependent metalloprotease [Parachitinimonas caeni]